MNNRCLFSVASWEDRFTLGIERFLSTRTVERAVVFYYAEFEEWTLDSRTKIVEICDRRSVQCDLVQISFNDSPGMWLALNETVAKLGECETEAIVDFSTMPREILWLILSLLRSRGIGGQYIYHTPATYHPEWLSRDPGRPRLVYKLSGVACLGQPTCLVVSTGFDPERTRQLMWFYEPRQVYLGFQAGDQFENTTKNVERHREALREEYREFEVIEFFVDAYGPDRGEKVLLKKVEAARHNHNVVLTSLGPKLGAVAHFKVQANYPEVALAYTPSFEFNREYSLGLKDSFEGKLDWHTV